MNLELKKGAERSVPVEVCIDSVSPAVVQEAVRAAYDGGAARVELCRAMEVDGLTPPPDHIRAAREAFGGRPGLLVMIRPRPGGFSYDARELRTMLEGIHSAAEAGADGVVVGVLRETDRRVDLPALQRLVEEARAQGLSTTFHRAVDAAADPIEAVEALASVGVDRVLTSGLPWGAPGSALDGTARLRQMIRRADGQLEVVIGGGVHAGNAGEILSRVPVARGCVSVHAYSGAQQEGRTTEAAVRTLVAAVREAGA